MCCCRCALFWTVSSSRRLGSRRLRTTSTLSPKVSPTPSSSSPRQPKLNAAHPARLVSCPADEEDAFDGDFASTDEDEGDYADEDAQEREVRREEKHARKVRSSSPASSSRPPPPHTGCLPPPLSC